MTNPADAPLRTAREIALERAELLAVLDAVAGEAPPPPIEWPAGLSLPGDFYTMIDLTRNAIFGRIDPSPPKA